MQYLYDSNSLAKNAASVNRFRLLYENGFPDPNEREEFGVILNRVKGEKQSYEPHSVMVLIGNEVAGGMIADWYAGSACLHLTYLIIDEKERGKGIARKLIEEGVPGLKKWIREKSGVEIKNVFFESNNPEKTITDNFPPEKRLRIFSGLGAKWIDIPYVQPALDADKKNVENLLLLTFPQFNTNGNKIKTAEIENFLKDLYVSLGVNNWKNNPVFQKMQESLIQAQDARGEIALKPVPVFETEQPRHEFRKASVTFHFTEEPALSGEDAGRKEPERGDFFYSFERDILNFQNQKKLPFYSTFQHQLASVLEVPRACRYTSEGKLHILQSARTALAVKTSVSTTFFPLSQVNVWHLTISPATNAFFTEYDLIKLATLFGSSQEASPVKDQIRIKIANGPEAGFTPSGFIRHIGQIPDSSKLTGSGTGIVEIDLEGTSNLPEKFLESFLSPQEDSLTDPLRSFAKVICGIILGIFDFARMDEEEIRDTIQPVMPNTSSFMVLCRGMLLKISNPDEIMEAVKEYTAVSPYLVIPSAVLAHNEHLLQKTLRELDRTLDPASGINLASLENIHSRLKAVINSQYLSDNFQYQSEQTIIRVGNLQRGILNIREKIANRLEELSEHIATKREKKSNLSDAFINAFLSLIAMVQLNSFLTGFFQVRIGLFLFLAELLLACFVFFAVRIKKR